MRFVFIAWSLGSWIFSPVLNYRKLLHLQLNPIKSTCFHQAVHPVGPKLLNNIIAELPLALDFGELRLRRLWYPAQPLHSPCTSNCVLPTLARASRDNAATRTSCKLSLFLPRQHVHVALGSWEIYWLWWHFQKSLSYWWKGWDLLESGIFTCRVREREIANRGFCILNLDNSLSILGTKRVQ